MSTESIPNSGEREARLLAKITFSRHEETNYTGEGRDITDRGIARAQEKGKLISEEKGAPVVIGHSPKPRARGTAESIEEGVRDNNDDTARARWLRIPGLRSTDFRDGQIHEELVERLGTTQEGWAEAHYNDPFFYDNPGRIETNEEKRARMYRELERLVAFLEKRDTGNDAPHLVFVSHYELLSLLLDDVFGIQTFGTTNTPTFGKHIDIDVYAPIDTGEVPVRVHFDGHEKQVFFDRKLRRLISK